MIENFCIKPFFEIASGKVARKCLQSFSYKIDFIVNLFTNF